MSISIQRISIIKSSLLALVLLFIFSCKNEQTTVSQDSVPYTSEMTKSDKKKYYDANENVVYEVKYKDDGFKLRTASAALIWKIKLYDRKIKISDNEENLNPYEIKLLEGNTAKLEKEEAVIARTEGEPTSLVNDIPTMPKDQKMILVSELKAKGY